MTKMPLKRYIAKQTGASITMAHYSAIKINKLLLMHTATWMGLKGIMLSGGRKPLSKVHILYDSTYTTLSK